MDTRNNIELQANAMEIPAASNELNSVKKVFQIDKKKGIDSNQNEKNRDLNENELIKSLHRRNSREDNFVPSPFQAQKPADIQSLINESDLSKVISKNPWGINIKKTLEDVQKRIYNSQEIKFRIGGRIIYSASQIVSAKSNLVIKDSFETKDELLINESDEEDLGSHEELDEDVMENFDQTSFSENSTELLQYQKPHNETGNNLLENKNLFVDEKQIPSSMDTTSDFISNLSCFYNIDEKGEKFLASPLRKRLRRFSFRDLGEALNKTLLSQLNSSLIRKERSKSGDLNVFSILPENILRKAEEDRAMIEEQIETIHQIIQRKYIADNPVPFLELIIKADSEGVVRTLLYLLHLVNRKKIELWQEIDEGSEDNSTFNIFAIPII